MDGAAGQEIEAAKARLRARLHAARRALPPETVTGARHGLAAAACRAPAVASAAVVCLYVSVGPEPGTDVLVRRLHERGVRVLLPVLRGDGDLDWAVYAGPGGLRAGRRAMPEPTGPRLGVEAVRGADAVLVPGLAAGRDGTRLGRGGGSYDRALARVPARRFTAVLLHDGELLDTVPVADHDRPVTAAVTPHGLVPLNGSRV